MQCPCRSLSAQDKHRRRAGIQIWAALGGAAGQESSAVHTSHRYMPQSCRPPDSTGNQARDHLLPVHHRCCSPGTVRRWRSWRRAAPQPGAPRSRGCLGPPAGCDPATASASAHIGSCSRCPSGRCPAPPCSHRREHRANRGALNQQVEPTLSISTRINEERRRPSFLGRSRSHFHKYGRIY